MNIRLEQMVFKIFSTIINLVMVMSSMLSHVLNKFTNGTQKLLSLFGINIKNNNIKSSDLNAILFKIEKLTEIMGSSITSFLANDKIKKTQPKTKTKKKTQRELPAILSNVTLPMVFEKLSLQTNSGIISASRIASVFTTLCKNNTNYNIKDLKTNIYGLVKKINELDQNFQERYNILPWQKQHAFQDYEINLFEMILGCAILHIVCAMILLEKIIEIDIPPTEMIFSSVHIVRNLSLTRAN